MSLTKEMLFDWLVENVYAERNELNEKSPLYSSGLLDSFSLMDLVVFIEKNANIKIGATDLTLDNMDRVERILAFVQKKLK
jgi:acyl carrier protein